MINVLKAESHYAVQLASMSQTSSRPNSITLFSLRPGLKLVAEQDSVMEYCLNRSATCRDSSNLSATGRKPGLLWPNGWMDQDATWKGGRPRPRRLCQMGRDPTPLPKMGRSPPNFRPMFIVAKLLDGSRWYLAWS